MAEKTPNQQLAEKLLFKPAYVGDKSAAVKQEAHAFAEGYKKFLDAGKTEREVAAESEQMLKDAGYQQFDPKKTYAPGDKVYFSQLGKAIVASTIGTRSFEDGFHLVIAHTDSPRLDLRPTPLYESDHFSYFKTHYYGGIRKYQWGTMPLAIHGVFSRADGTTVSVNVGEDENDPVFCITDLLPHLGAEQSERKLSDGIEQSLRVDDSAVFKLLQSGDVHALERFGKDVVEAALRDAAGQRHLAAFEADADAAAAAGLLALMTAACGLAVAGRVAAALALADMGGAHNGRKFVDIHVWGPPYSSSVTATR